MSKYPKGVQWIKELLYDTKFTPERLKIIASKLLNEITQCKKAGNKITGDLMRGMIYNKGNIQISGSNCQTDANLLYDWYCREQSLQLEHAEAAAVFD